MNIAIKDVSACIGKSEKDAGVKKLLAALGVKKVPPPKKETWKGMGAPVTVLNGYAKVVAAKHGVMLELDFPTDREGFTERPLSHEGPRSVTRVVLYADRVRADGTTFTGFAGPVILDWSLADPLDLLRARAKEKGKAYAKGPGKTPDSIRIGKVSYVIYRKAGNKAAERVELTR